MTQEEQYPKGSMVTKRSLAPIVCFGILTCLNVLFWFTANFRSFHPPSDGSFRERLFMFGVTEAGPLAFLMAGNYIFAVVISIVILMLAFFCIFAPQKKALKVTACIGIILWFFFGFCVAGLRIT
jgi:hypothetical protein